mmetsp:Transcript_16754/g.19403  ORF Transcript_16754/g.19403 Transcript_16754/m.19403 type:complete len:97 (+) Transcript_16754:325-615(+)
MKKKMPRNKKEYNNVNVEAGMDFHMTFRPESSSTPPKEGFISFGGHDQSGSNDMKLVAERETDFFDPHCFRKDVSSDDNHQEEVITYDIPNQVSFH